MTINAAAYITVSPAFHEPEILMQYTQTSGFVDTLADHQLRTRLGDDDLLIYMKQLNVRTRAAAGQSSYNELPGVDITASMISTPTYLIKVRAEYDHHDVAAAGRWGFSAQEAYRLGGRQANFQLARDACLKGMHPETGEGLLHAPGITAQNLPPDSNGATTVVTYDNGDMAFYLMQVVLAIKTRTLQLGSGRKFTFIGPQRTLGLFQYNVVQLVQFQRTGAGSASTVGLLEAVLGANEDQMTWTYDDTLIGAGSGGYDAVIVVMTELDRPAERGPINTNEFANLLPGNKVVTTQYCNTAAPVEIISPLAGGATDFLQEWRISSGWAVRPEGVTVISMQYQ